MIRQFASLHRRAVVSAVLLAWIALAVSPLLGDKDKPAEAAPDEAKAEAALAVLKERFQTDKANREKLWQDLLAFRHTYPGTTPALQAAELLRQLPSPLDKLDSKTIPAVERYDWQPKELVAVLGEHKGRNGAVGQCVLVTPDGKSVISGGNHSLMRFWEPLTMRIQSKLLSTHYVNALAITKDGKTLACGGGDGLIHLWDMSGKEPKPGAVLKAPTPTAIYALAISPSGKRLACNGEGGTVRLWDITGKEPKELAVLTGHTKMVHSVSFSADGATLASGSEDEKVRLWDLTKSPVKDHPPIPAHTGEVRAVAFSPIGKTLATASLDGLLWLWSVTGTTAKDKAHFKIPAIYTVTISPDGKTVAAGCGDGSIHLFMLGSSSVREGPVLLGHVGYVAALAFAPDGKGLVSGGGDCTIRYWQMTGMRPVEKTVKTGHLCHAYAVAFAPDGKTLASGGVDTTIRLWDLTKAEPKEAAVLKPNASHVLGLDFAPDGKTLVSAHYDTTVRLWNLAAKREVRQLKGHKDPVRAVAYSPVGHQVLTGSAKYRSDGGGNWDVGDGQSLRLWDASTGKEIRQFGNYKEPVLRVAFSPDGRRAVSGGTREELRMTKWMPLDCSVRLWDVANGNELALIEKHERPVYSVAFTADGTRTISSSIDGAVKLWNLEKENDISDLPGVSEYVASLAVAPDGKTIAGAGAYGKLYLWDAATFKKVKEIQLREGITWIAYAPDSRHLAAAIIGGPVYILRLGEEQKSEGK